MDSFFESPPIDLDMTDPPYGALGRSITLGIVSGLCKFLLYYCNSIDMRHLERLHSAALERPPDRPLLTVCNHTSTLDDPGVMSAIIPWRAYWTDHKHDKIRWSLAAKELLFTNRIYSAFFLAGKVLPVERGAGVDQPIMHVASSLLAKNKWVHIFPEGRISFTGELLPFRWGVGKLLCDAVAARPPEAPLPLVLPFHHAGMGNVLPPRRDKVPRVGKHIVVTIGEPIEMDDLLCKCRPKHHAFNEAMSRDCATTRRGERNNDVAMTSSSSSSSSSRWFGARWWTYLMRRRPQDEADRKRALYQAITSRIETSMHQLAASCPPNPDTTGGKGQPPLKPGDQGIA